MSATYAADRIEPESGIKQEEEDVEWSFYTSSKRSCTEEESSATGDAHSRTESRETQTGEKRAEGGGKRRKTNDTEPAEEEVTQIIIKEESEEEWSEEDEPPESDCSQYDPDDGHYFSDNSEDDFRRIKRRVTDADESEDAGDEGLSWEFRSAPDVTPEPLTFEPARTPGPTLATSSAWTPLSVFQLFFSAAVIRKIVENTNKNGERQEEAGVRQKWTPITAKDFYMFLNTVLFTSLVKLHDQNDYWRKHWPYRFQFPGGFMLKRRFDQIQRALYLCDPEKDAENETKKGTPEYDKLFTIQPFFSEMVNACMAHFQPHSNICVHERKMRRDKPLKCGYRLFALADSSTGYTWNMCMDTGKSAATRGQSAGYTAVMNLLPGSAIGGGYTLYTDGLFSSPRLFTQLLRKRIGCCGVLSKHHSEFPRKAQNDFPSPASRGDIRWLRKDGLLFVKWMDTREVAMCSTVHEAFTGQVIKRPVKEGKGWVGKQFSCPDVVAEFNRHMVVSGKSDFSYCFPCTRVKFWHRILFFDLFDVAVVNSFILYKEMKKLRGEAGPKAVTQKDFREMLCKEMYKFSTGKDPDTVQASAAARDVSVPSVLCLPLYYVHGSATHGRKLCKICGKKTPIYCQKCLVSLCLTSWSNCFKEWHEIQ